MRTYFRSILRSFRKNAAKLFSLTFIMLLGIAFVSGLGTLSPSVLDSLGAALDEARVPDLIVKAESASGFTADQAELLRGLPFVEAAESLTVLDADDGGVNTRICVYSSFDTQLNRLSVEGRLPERAGEVLVERQNNATQSYAPGDAVTVLGTEYTVAGVASNPLIFDRLGEPSMIGGTLQKIVYFSASEFPLSVPVTDVYVRVAWEGERDYFSDEYAAAAAGFAARVEAALGEGFTVLTLAENKSAVTAESYCDKVSVIAAVFPVFFILVAALVVMTTMSRMIEEEREILGCLCSLGAGGGPRRLQISLPGGRLLPGRRGGGAGRRPDAAARSHSPRLRHRVFSAGSGRRGASVCGDPVRGGDVGRRSGGHGGGVPGQPARTARPPAFGQSAEAGQTHPARTGRVFMAQASLPL